MACCALTEKCWKAVTEGLEPAVVAKWWKLMLEKYHGSDRHYHNMFHLEHKFVIYECVKSDLKVPDAVALALFFQYFEYDPKAADCTAANIEMFTQFCTECDIPLVSSKYQDVVALLEGASTSSTEEHKIEGAYGTEDIHYFLDIDMAILGSGFERYMRYAERIRKEYAFLTETMYKSLRVKVLQNFLQIPNIFATKFFRDKFEQAARENIQEEIKMHMTIL